MYHQRYHWSKAELARAYIRDLARDLRSSQADHPREPEWIDYIVKLRKEITELWPARHAPKIDRYGVPMV